MKRKAILIESSNVKGQDDLPGARVDMQNWANFLKSALGGGWLDSEVVPMSKPFSSDVNRELTVDADCYCFVAFSGHGSNGSVVLNDYLDKFSISNLMPRSRKGAVIVDSCRGIETKLHKFGSAAILASESLGRAVVHNSRGGHSTNFGTVLELLTDGLDRHRNVWIRALEGASKGVAEMLACSKGQGAAEDPSAGGYYTSLLLQSADLWQQYRTMAGVHTTKDAHDHAAGMLPPQQTPEYRPSWLAFPFAVKA